MQNNIRVFMGGKLIFSGAHQEQQHAKPPPEHQRRSSLDFARLLSASGRAHSAHSTHTAHSGPLCSALPSHSVGTQHAGARPGNVRSGMGRVSSYSGLSGLLEAGSDSAFLKRARSQTFNFAGLPAPAFPSAHPRWVRALEHQLMPFLAVAMASPQVRVPLPTAGSLNV